MLYVLIGLVVTLALVCGAEYAMLRLNNAEYRAEVANLTRKNAELERKLKDMNRWENVKEGIL